MSESARALLAIVLIVMVVAAGILVARRLAKRSYPPGYQKPALTTSKVLQIVGLAVVAIVACVFLAYGAIIVAIASGDNNTRKYFSAALCFGIPATIVLFFYLANRIRRR